MRPIKGGSITFPYGVRGNMWAAGFHPGDDWAAPVGTPVHAIVGGRVIFQGLHGGWGAAYGYHVVIEGRFHVRRIAYCHLSRIYVSVGQRVKRGQVIGLSGATGNVTGPHVHIEQRTKPFLYNNHFVKPRYYL